MKSRLACFASVVLSIAAITGCATPDNEPDESLGGTNDEIVSAPAASGEGEIDGNAVTFAEGAAHALTRLKSGRKVTAASSQIDLSSGRNTCTEWKKKAQMLSVSFKNGEGDIEEGMDFEVAAGGDSALGASAQFWLTDDDCEMAIAKISAKSGHVRITKATPQRIIGEYDLDFGDHGKVKGTFDAPTCLKALESVPACKK